MSRYIQQGANIGASRGAQRMTAQAARDLERDLQQVLKKLKEIPLKALSARERKKALRKASKPLIAAARAKAPVMKSRRKATVTLKSGERVTYYPGNLQLSIKEISFSKARAAVFVGPKITKRRKGGDEYGKTSGKVDAYYAAMVEYGTRNMPAKPYMRPAFESSKGEVMRIAEAEVKKLLQAWAAKNTVR
jgi:HK97 gp10 family phage protein